MGKIYCALLMIGLCITVAPVRSRAATESIGGGPYLYQDRSAHLAYTLKNIPNSGIPIQNFYVTSNYVMQHKELSHLAMEYWMMSHLCVSRSMNSRKQRPIKIP